METSCQSTEMLTFPVFCTLKGMLSKMPLKAIKVPLKEDSNFTTF